MTAELSPDDLAKLREIVSKLRSLNNTPEESLLIATVVRLLDEVERLRGLRETPTVSDGGEGESS